MFSSMETPTSSSAGSTVPSAAPDDALQGASEPEVLLLPFSIPKDGRSLRTLSNGVNCTPEKRLIAVQYVFRGKSKRPLAEAAKALGVGKTTIYKWKAECDVWLSASQSSALKAHVAAIQKRSDEQNLSRFLDLSPAINSPSPSGAAITRPDGLGPNAEAKDPVAGSLQPGDLPLEVLDNICRVGGAELPTDEEVEKIGLVVDDDLNEEGEALVEESLTNAVTLHKSSQRSSTQNIWKGPQQKFLAFFRGLARLRAENANTDAGSEDGDPRREPVEVLVTEQKLVTFLNCLVLRKKPWLAVETIDSHIKAITDLWKQQQLAGKNSHPSPREGGLVKAYRTAIIKSKARQSAASYEDKAKHSLADGYDELGHERISRWYLQRATKPRMDEHACYRARLDFLLSHAIMGRSEDLRHAKLSDMYSYALPYSSPHPCQALVITFLESKANTGGRKERGVAIRHRNVEVCPIGALALYLFYRFDACAEKPPDFTTRREWYDLPLLVASANPSAGISWDTQADLLGKAFAELDITSSKLTHAMRGGGARFASAAGCSEDSIRKHGRWCGDRLMERYLTSVAITPVRALGGFSIQGGDHWLARSLREPSSDLSGAIFPWVEEAEATLENKSGSDRDEAGIEFLKLLKFLRRVLLQDAVSLKALFPTLPLWQHKPFNTTTFAEFASELQNAINTTPCPLDAQLSSIVPTISHALGDVRGQVYSLKNNHDDFKILLESTAQQVNALYTRIFEQPVGDDEGQRTALVNAHAALIQGIQTMTEASQQISAASFSSSSSSSPFSSAPGQPSAVSRQSTSSSSSLLLLPPPPSSAINSGSGSSLIQTSAQLSPSPQTTDFLPTVTTMVELVQVWTQGGGGRQPLSGFSTSGHSGAVQQKVSRWRRLMGFVEEMALRETGEGGKRRSREVDEVAETIDRAIKKRKVGLRKLVDVVTKESTKVAFLEELEWV
ncbi:hypothetical protein A4X13_0g7841 [Tilletia indica]|uniref:Ndc10 domain-containing protein n=1 Tax=Tilletia indica TaxID=43049 RepID=A0A8T8SHP0_9BASI|nr:hypothetical protein A4X13_0g7841 [Tilletia indica]